MNKQEAIKKLESIKVIGNDALAACYNESINAGITLMKKIDEPQKAIAQLAEKWHEDIGPVLWWDFPVEEPPYCGTPLDDDFPKYKTHFTELRIPDEVEKEPLYTVTINLDRKYHLVVDEVDGNDEISTTLTTTHGVLGYRYFLTEKEIKLADENLWPFAVPVEEEAI